MLISDFFQLVAENVCALTLIMWPRFNETKSENNGLPNHCNSIDHCKNQLPSLSVSGTLVENGLIKPFTIHQKINQFWHHQMRKHQNITGTLVFTIVFCFNLFDWNAADLMFFARQNACARWNECAAYVADDYRPCSSTQFL